MTKRFTKIIAMVVLIIMSIVLFAGCEDGLSKKSVVVWIKAEYRDEFFAEEFTIKDFNWDNISKITYSKWYEEFEKGWVTIHLKKHGRIRVKNAVTHFNTLHFVDSAEPTPILKAY